MLEARQNLTSIDDRLQSDVYDPEDPEGGGTKVNTLFFQNIIASASKNDDNISVVDIQNY